jgi:SulP family sulfate permease
MSVGQFPGWTRLLAGARARAGAMRGTWKRDLIAGITVSLVAIPQSLAYAQLAGVPAYLGLYAALLPTIVGALFGSSAQLSTGPVALTSLLTAASVAPLAPRGSEAFIADVILLALLSGVFQLTFGLLRLGVVLNFLSHPVLMGFINAAAIIIALSQMPTLLGIAVRPTDHFLLDIASVLRRVHHLHLPSLAFGLVAICMLVAFRRLGPRMPGVLITVVILTGVSALSGYGALGGAEVGTVPGGLPRLGLPAWDGDSALALLPAALVIAVISFMEAMSSAKVISIRTGTPWDENRELVGQGLAKIASALSLSMPVSGSFSRSALNLASNAASALSSVFSALAVLLTVLLFTPLLEHLPKPVLAAIIMMAVSNLVNLAALRRAWRANRDDGAAAIVTFTATLVFAPNIQVGILVGILLSVGLVLVRLMRPRVAVLGMHADGTLRDAVRHGLDLLHPRLRAVRFDGDLRFMNVSYFENAIVGIERDNPEAKCILLACGGINHIDATAIEALMRLVLQAHERGVTLVFSGIKKQVQDVMDRTGLTRTIGDANIFATDREAIDTLRRRLAEPAQGNGPG